MPAIIPCSIRFVTSHTNQALYSTFHYSSLNESSIILFSEIIDLQTKLLIGAAVGAGVIAATGLALWYAHRRIHGIPKK